MGDPMENHSGLELAGRFSGSFNFKNILFKLIHSWKKAFGVDKKRFSRSNVVLN